MQKKVLRYETFVIVATGFNLAFRSRFTAHGCLN